MKFAIQTGLFLLVLLLIIVQPTVLMAQDAKTKADLAAAKAALQKEYQALSALKGELEQARQNAKTDQDVAAFKKKLAQYEHQVQSYDEKRKNYEGKLQAIADAEARKRAILETALADQETGQVESAGADDKEVKASAEKQDVVSPETEELKAMEPAKTTAAGVKDKAMEARAFQAEKKILDKRKEEIDKEFEALNKEREELEARRQERMRLPDANALDEDSGVFNEKIQKFNERRKELEQDAADFNKRLTGAGLAVSEKKTPEEK